MPEKWGHPFYASPAIPPRPPSGLLISFSRSLSSYLAPRTQDPGEQSWRGQLVTPTVSHPAPRGHTVPGPGPSAAQPEGLCEPSVGHSWASESPRKLSSFPSRPPLPPSPGSPTKLCFLLSHRGAARMPLATSAKKAFLI